MLTGRGCLHYNFTGENFLKEDASLIDVRFSGGRKGEGADQEHSSLPY